MMETDSNPINYTHEHNLLTLLGLQSLSQWRLQARIEMGYGDFLGPSKTSHTSLNKMNFELKLTKSRCIQGRWLQSTLLFFESLLIGYFLEGSKSVFVL